MFRNGSGYADPTAYKALSNIERDGKMEFKRGEIFEYAVKDDTRKAMVVSADFRKKDHMLSIIVLTDEQKGSVCVPITTGSGIMYADCGMVAFAQSDRFGNYLRTVKQAEMDQIDEGIAKCLGIEQQVRIVKSEAVPEIITPIIAEPSVECFSEELATAKAEAKIFKDLYEKLLAKVMG